MRYENIYDNINKYLYKIAKKKGTIDGEIIHNVIVQLDCDEEEALEYAYRFLKSHDIVITDEQDEDVIHQINPSNNRLLTFEEECKYSQQIIEANEAIKKLNDYPNDDVLLGIINKGKLAKEELIGHNYGLVVNIAKKYLTTSIDIDDLIQEGNMGLMKAIEKYDYRLGFRFSTYAYSWIRHYISKFVKENYNIMLPISVQSDLNLIQKAKKTLSVDFDEANITPEQIYNVIGGKISLKRIKELLCLNVDMVKLNSKINSESDSSELIEHIADSSYKETDFDYPVGWEKLSKIEKDVFSSFYKDKESLSDIANKYGLSISRIRQIKDKTKRKLQIYNKQDLNR